MEFSLVAFLAPPIYVWGASAAIARIALPASLPAFDAILELAPAAIVPHKRSSIVVAAVGTKIFSFAVPRLDIGSAASAAPAPPPMLRSVSMLSSALNR